MNAHFGGNLIFILRVVSLSLFLYFAHIWSITGRYFLIDIINIRCKYITCAYALNVMIIVGPVYGRFCTSQLRDQLYRT